MEELFGGLAFIGIMVCATFTLGHSITPENVTPELFSRAVVACEPNSGLKVLEMDAFYHDARCNNGAVFQVAIPADRKQ